MRIGVDSNILAYAEGVNDEFRQAAALTLLARLPYGATIISVQVLGELNNVLVRKGGWTRSAARDAIFAWRNAFTVCDTSADVMLAAADLAAEHNTGIWDAVILAAASRSECRVLLSEDLQHGFTWGGVTVVNPFASPIPPMLSDMFVRDRD